MIKPYSKEIETQMQKLYRSMSEKNRYLYAGVEALKMPNDGVGYISKLFGCSEDMVLMGIEELNKSVAK